MQEQDKKKEQKLQEEEQTTQETKQPIDFKEKEENFREKFLRLNADLQNYKRRVERERSGWMQIAQADILNKLLPFFDELDRAIEISAQNNPKISEDWLKGFSLIQKSWEKEFAELGIEEIDTSGTFDPELHDALMQVESKEKEPGEVVQLLSKGYKFKDKVIKHAKVSVAK